MIRCCIEEEFYFNDDRQNTLRVSGGDFYEIDEFTEYTKENAISFLENCYNDWIVGTEPEGWVDDCYKILLVGYFWTDENSDFSDELEIITIKGNEEEY